MNSGGEQTQSQNSAALTTPRRELQPPGRARVRSPITSYEELPLFGTLLILMATFAIWQPLFLTSRNFTNLATQGSVLMILGCAQLFVVLAGGIDISVGAQVSLLSIFAVELSNSLSTGLAVTLACAIGAGVGLVNGVLVVVAKVSPIIATLGMWQVLGGFALWYTDGLARPATNSAFISLGRGEIGPIAVPTIIAIGSVCLAWVMLNRTLFGRYTLALGGNTVAARLSGIPVGLTMIGTYVVCGVGSGVAAVVLAARVSSGLPDLGSGLEILAIAAVFIGGVAWGGGVGRASGVVLGVLLITTLSNGFALAAISTDVQTIVTGILIVTAVSMNAFRKDRLSRG